MVRKALNLLILLFFLLSIFPNQVVSSSSESERSDPPFFKLELAGGKNVYVLGSVHPIAPDVALDAESAYRFLISEELLGTDETAIFIEHECSNTMFSYIRHKKRKITPWFDSFREWVLGQSLIVRDPSDKQFVSSLGVLPSLEMSPIILSLDLSNSRLTFDRLFRVRSIFNENLWIADRIIKSQLGLQLYKIYGGFEYNILRTFQERDLHFLETPEDYYNTLQLNEWEQEELFSRINSSLINLNAMAQITYSPRQLNLIYNYEWVDDSPYTLDETLILARNSLWITNLIDKRMLSRVLETKNNVLIVVGFAHLMEKESFVRHKGFLRLLIDATRPTGTFRYSYRRNDWVPWI